jgi:hypothetical protein
MTQALEELALIYAQLIAEIFNNKAVPGQISRMTAGARLISYWSELDDPMDLKAIMGISENIALACHVKNVIAFRQGGYILFQLQLPKMFWTAYERGKDVLGLEMGLTDTRKPVVFSFNPPHHLVAAATNEGKSYTVKNMLIGLFESFTPDALQVVMCDKHGDFVRFKNEAHLVRFQWGTNAYDFDKIKQAIIWVYDQLIYRMERKIKDDSKIILVIDEVESIIRQDGGKGSQLTNILTTITEEARKFQIFVIVTSKKPTQENLPNIVHSLGNRWIGKMNLDYSTTAAVMQQGGINLNQLIGKGDFFHIGDKGIERFLVAKIPDSIYDKLERIDRTPVKIENREINFQPEKKLKKGRPSLRINPIILSYYIVNGWDKISHVQANDLGWTRTQHELHKEAAVAFMFGYCKLKGKSSFSKFYQWLKSNERGNKWLSEIKG